MADIGLITAAKKSFFDRAKVLAAADRAVLRGLSKFGAFVRTRARSSIRKRKRTSEPGQPPSSHTGRLKKFLFFAFDGFRSVVIGPARIGGAVYQTPPAPGVLEHGGRVVRRPSVKQRSRGADTVRVFTIRARPFMAPALAAETAAGNAPRAFKNAFRKSA